LTVEATLPLGAKSGTDSDAVPTEIYHVLSLDSLVRMKLNSYRRTDRVHLLDLLNVGLIDCT
jgi:hypothetical protein